MSSDETTPASASEGRAGGAGGAGTATPASSSHGADPATPATSSTPSAGTTTGQDTTSATTSSTTSSTEVAALAGDDGGGAGAPLVPVALLLALAVAAAIAGFVVGRRSRDVALGAGRTPTAAPPPPSPATTGAHDELVAALIDARDRIGPGPISDRIGEALSGAGVETIDPTGRLFDPGSHTAQAPPALTTDPGLDGTIAAVVSLGYAEGGVVRRLPVVVVHRFDGETPTVTSSVVPRDSS